MLVIHKKLTDTSEDYFRMQPDLKTGKQGERIATIHLSCTNCTPVGNENS